MCRVMRGDPDLVRDIEGRIIQYASLNPFEYKEVELSNEHGQEVSRTCHPCLNCSRRKTSKNTFGKIDVLSGTEVIEVKHCSE